MRRPISYLLISGLLACQQPAKIDNSSPEQGGPSATQPDTKPSEVAFARLGRFELKEWEFFLSIQLATDMLRKQGASQEDLEKYKDEIREKSKEATIEGFIISSVLAREAERRGEKVSPAELNAERQKQFKDRKPPANTSEADIMAVLERNILANRLVKSLGGEVTLSDAEAEQFYRDALTKVKLAYVLLAPSATPTDEELKAYATSHAAEIKAYYDANQKEFVSPEAVKVKHILIKTSPGAVGDDLKPAKDKIEGIAAEISEGLKFDEAAQKYSEDASSKAQGGALDWLSRGQMLKPFAEVAFSLQPGQISKPVKTALGYHLIVLQEKRPEQPQVLADVELQIAAQLYSADNAATKAAAQKVIDELKAGKKLEEIAAANTPALEVHKTPDFSAAQKAIPGLGSDEALVAAVKALTKEKSFPEAPLGMGQSFVVPVLLSKEEPDMQPFTENKEQIKGAILEERQKEKTDEWIKSARKQEAPYFEVNRKVLPKWPD